MKTLDPLGVDLRGALIEASAGTGKTFTIATLYLRFLLEERVTAPSILVVTFTKAATAELRDRIRDRVRSLLTAFEGAPPRDTAEASLLRRFEEPSARAAAEQDLRAALSAFDEASIFTIHGFCQRVLAEHAFESGQRDDVELAARDDELIGEVVRDFWVRELHDDRELAKALEKVTIASLEKIVRHAIASPDLRIRPDVASAADLRELTDRLRASIEPLRAAWESCAADVRDLLLHSASLNRTNYRLTAVRSLLTDLEALFSTPPARTVDLPEAFDKLGTAMIIAGTKNKHPVPMHRFFALCDPVIENRRALLRARKDSVVAFRGRLIDYARAEVAARKDRAGAQSFDDLLLSLDRALSGPLGDKLAGIIRQEYPAALIDEFQDTDPLQYRIFQRIYAGHTRAPFLIGDPKQAIYAFRGADVFAYLAAAGTAKQAYTLGTNWRSDPPAVAAVNAVFGKRARPFLLDDIGYPKVLARPGAEAALKIRGSAARGLEILFVPRTALGNAQKNAWTQVIARATAVEIAKLVSGSARLSGRPVVPADIAVLVLLNAQADVMQKELRALGIASVVQGDSSVLVSPEARDLHELLRAIADPTRATLTVALSNPIFARSAEDLARLEEDEDAWEEAMKRLHDWRNVWLSQGFAAAFRRVLEDEGVPRRLLASIGGDRRLTNLLHLGELTNDVAMGRHLGLAGTVEWLAEARADDKTRDELGREAAQIRLEGDDAAVKLVTVYKSKGLEYPIVYCPFLWAARRGPSDYSSPVRFHDPGPGHAATLDLGGPELEAARELFSEEESAEALRIAYVALTRARHRTSIVWGHLPSAERSPLAYLLHGRGGEGDRNVAAERVKKLSDGDLLAELHSFSKAHPAVAIATLSVGRPEQTFLPLEGEPPALSSRIASRRLAATFRTSSFSALTSGVDTSARHARGIDRDAVPASDDEPLETSTDDGLGDFPAGPRAGDLLHAVLEEMDFEGANETNVRALAERHLRLRGFDGDRFGAVVTRGLLAAVDTPLTEDRSLSLRKISRAQRRAELEFILPLRRGGEDMVTPAKLASVFATTERAPVPASYATSLRDLGFVPIEGFLRGFIDLVFEHQGRFYIVDYKSNRLGPAAGDYATTRLTRPMTQHHYVLQYHLYAVALDLFLARRVPSYRYETHFGGVYYLFLRGMSPARGPRNGVYFDLPPEPRIAALRRLFGEEPRR